MGPMPLVISRPKETAFGAEVLCPSAEPGDVCNRYGDLRGADVANMHSVIKSGVVYVTPAQADAAALFGWDIVGEWPEDAGLVQIARS